MHDQDLSSASTGATAITIGADDVILDCNDFLLDGLAGGATTSAIGVFSSGHANVHVRHCNIRGFKKGVSLDAGAGHGSRIVVEGNHFSRNTDTAAQIYGSDNLVRRSVILDSGTSTSVSSFGIHAIGTVDIIDNTIFGLSHSCGTGTCSGGEGIQTNRPQGRRQ